MQPSKQNSQQPPPSDFDLLSVDGLEDDPDYKVEDSGAVKIFRKFPFKEKKQYKMIADDLRLQLIDLVENKGQKIKHAAKALHINYSTAKSICQIYKREGRTGKKIFKRRGLQEDGQIDGFQSYDNYFANPQNNSDNLNELSSPFVNSSPPEKDSLQLLRDKLLQSRNSSLTQPQNNNSANLEFQFNSHFQEPQINPTQESQFRTNDSFQQNHNKVLGDSFSSVNSGVLFSGDSNKVHNQSPYFYSLGSIGNLDSQTFDTSKLDTNEAPQQARTNTYPSHVVNVTQPQLNHLNNGTDNLPNMGSLPFLTNQNKKTDVNDNNTLNHTVQTPQISTNNFYLPIYTTDYSQIQSQGQPQYYFAANSVLSNQGIPTYQPIMYLIPQLSNLQNPSNGANMQNFQNHSNFSNIYNLPNLPNLQAMQMMQSMQNMQSLQNMQNMHNMHTMQNMQNPPINQNIQNVQNNNMQNLQNHTQNQEEKLQSNMIGNNGGYYFPVQPMVISSRDNPQNLPFLQGNGQGNVYNVPQMNTQNQNQENKMNTSSHKTSK